jgi:methionyl-tRNA formyltransferase
MKILYFGNNWLGWKVLEWLAPQRDEIAGLVLHPPDRRKLGDELLAAARASADCVFDGSRLRDPAVLQAIRDLRADLAVSVLFGYILRPELLELFPSGAINLHPSLLPFNRGACPNVWSIADGTPAGATLHYVDARVDTGDIIAQSSLEVEPVDTGESLYRKLEQLSLDLFRQTWPRFREGAAPRTPQPAGCGTAHRLLDLKSIDEIDLDRQYTGRELINILRARTFAPYPGAYFRAGGRRVYMRLELEYGNAVE